MGAAHSTPPPLVEVNAPGGKVLVPPGTAFSVHPPNYSRSRCNPYSRGPVYLPAGKCHSPPYKYGRRRGPGRRRPRPDIDITEGSEDSESILADTMDGMSPQDFARGMGRQGSKGYPGVMGGMGGMMGGMGGRGGGSGYFEGMDMRPRSAPEMPLGAYPGMGGMGGMGMGMPSPRMGGLGMNPMGGMGGMGGMEGMPPSGMPPEYTSNPSIPRYSGAAGGMTGAGINPYASYPGPPPSPPSSDGAPRQPTRQASRNSPGHYDHVPMGAYTAGSDRPRKPSRSRTEPQTSAQLNRGQPPDRRAGSSGREWLDGDAFLDACVCTTGCKCRKSQRVLYRSREDRTKGGDSDDGDPAYGSGEIRYILKDDLGRDCGDHSGCRKSDTESERESKSKKGKNRREGRERKDQFEGFKEDLLEALDERFEGLKKESQQRGKPGSASGSPFGRPNMGPSPFMMDEANLDPRLAQQMGMMSSDPYGMGMPGIGRMPQDMTDLMGKRSMRPPGMSMGPMAAAGMTFEDEMSMADVDGMGPLGMGNPYMSAGMMGKKPMRPDFMSPRRTKGAGKFGPGGMGLEMDMDPMTFYGRGVGMRGRGGMSGGRHPGGGPRRPRPDFGSDDFDLGPSRRPGMGRRGDNDEAEAAFGGGGLGDDDEDGELAATHRRASCSRRGRGVQSSRDKQPRADTDDDDAY